MKIHVLGCLVFCLTACAPKKSDSSDQEGSRFPPDSVDAGAVDAGGTGLPLPFRLLSSAFEDEGVLPAEFTCDGVGQSPPMRWTNAPQGTTEFALMMSTLAKDGQKWNWVLFDLQPSVQEIPSGAQNVGTQGLTSDGPNLAYSPPCSQGPGAKRYSFTIYALSSAPSVPTSPLEVTGAVLTQAISKITLASDTIDVSYTRQ